MFYKEIKYLAGHRILSLLNKECRIYTRFGKDELYMPSYLWTDLPVLHKKAKLFKIDTLRDAVLMLKENNEVIIRDNKERIYDIQVGVNENGLKAYKEKVYIWKILKSVKIIIIALGSIGASIFVIKSLLQLLLRVFQRL